jgi:cathepsin F
MKFIKQHNKVYHTITEFNEKFAIFKTNLSNVEETTTFSAFMDISADEFSARLTLDSASFALLRSTMTPYKLVNDIELPISFDWREKDAVTHVKDQGQCGSCWAFSAVANIEGRNAVKNGKLSQFSEQQLVDCDHNGDQGCNGGLMDNAFQYLMNAGGLELESEYPYAGRENTCRFDKSKVALKVTGFSDISKNEDEIAKVLIENGPLAVAINASPFQFYSGGILKVTARSCNPRQLNHGVTLVGFGEEEGVKFWIVKNSWSAVWGEQGYIRLQRGVGACGINTMVSTAEVE